MVINKKDIVKKIIKNPHATINTMGKAYAPANIALAKYWGKRNDILNLPFTSSLSISLANYGATTTITTTQEADQYFLNQTQQDPNTEFSLRLKKFLDLFRPAKDFYFNVATESTVPIAAGLASSAAGFAALTLALDQFFNWNLDKQQLSILARLGSGSASRSLFQGFVEWNAGDQEDGMDSYAHPLPEKWPELRIGLLLLDSNKKPLSSREAMQRTVETSPYYHRWPEQVAHAIEHLHQAIHTKDFELLGKTSEKNALGLHATMLTAQPPVCYWLPETLQAMQHLWTLRTAGISVYFTQDAGPNLKLLFLEKDLDKLTQEFPKLITINPFSYEE